MPDTVRPARTGRWPILLLVLVAVVVAAWSGGWFYLRGEVASRMDAELARLKETRGIAVTCPDRAISGWPFRVDIDCRGPTATAVDPGAHAGVAALRIAALVYQPSRVILEADGPLAAAGPHGETIAASWSLLQASLGLSGFRPERVSVAVDALSAAITPAGAPENRLTAEHAEVHLRPAPDAAPGSVDFDVVARFEGLSLARADKPVGPQGSNLEVTAVARHVPTARRPGVSPAKAWAENGGALDISSARLAIGRFAVEGTGTLAADGDGNLNGSLKLTATGLESLLLGGGSLKSRAEVVALAGAFMAFGKPADTPQGRGRSLDLVIDKGTVKIGSTTLARLPPLI